MEPPVGIYQPFYKPSLIERLDPGFIPLDWLANPMPALRELALHHHIATHRLFARHRLTGLLSPKFFAKTRLRSQQVYDWIADHPGRDVYVISGGSHVPYVNFNSVERSQLRHSPLFEQQMRSLCRRIGFDLPKEFPRQTNANRSAASYWIASAAFWESWIADVIAPIFALIDSCEPSDEIFTFGKHSSPTPVYVLTFIYERLIDHYIENKGIDAIYYPWDQRSILSLEFVPPLKAHLEVMIPLVDRIDAAGPWSERDKAWLKEQSAAITSRVLGPEMLTTDVTDYDLPRHYPNELARGT